MGEILILEPMRLGTPEGVPGYHDLEQYSDARQFPNLLVIDSDTVIFFANANLFRRIL